jgi:4-hydroxy-tetrahydrodipicolinate synthase
MKLEGVYTPVITPFKPDLSIDEAAFEQVIEFQIQVGIAGIFVSGTTGESYALSFDERVRLFGLAKDIIGKRLPMFAGIGASNTADMIALGQAARAVGADGLLMPAPYYACPTETELARHAIKVDRAVGLPIVLYNYPGRTGSTMGTTFLNQVRKHKNFCAIKETSGDINRLHTLALEYDDLQLSCGMDDQALEFFTWGARSWIAGGGNCLPEEHIALYKACAIEKDFVKGREIMAAMMPLMSVLENGGQFLPCVKYACELAGLRAGRVRPPLSPLGGGLKKKMAEAIKTLKAKVKAIERKSARKSTGRKKAA